MRIGSRFAVDSHRLLDLKGGRFDLRSRIHCFLVLLVFLVGGVQAGCSEKKGDSGKAGTSVETGVDVGQVAPDFKAKNLKGGLTTLSQYRGKVVMVNFWATWCGPCLAEMPSMEAMYQRYPRGDFEILAVSIDTIGEPPVHAFVQELNLSFPILMDSQFILNDYYQVRVVPTSILIDRKGIVSQRVLGAKDWTNPDARILLEKLIQAKG
jgi:peroxiredoxin